ncbi:putative bifunctional diguanylate cyclase/phosphodiesterase [[Clostridium] polysaccharolyticum]|uniref:Diguanylate cyclase (GGDEF) domain-containing protein n=1 Tax=[Clostridium] polysaccharolyticum TaxID=29364 RepID=A0A1H9ZUI7_9FIRM|nr:EAL domain-containing protein [[Clostridium] polysaccharolyticum]SES84497.1 diguanylate cyclase (GGDEF) domain-containing protein [[Clostridium] polysaccharolyticum]
MDKRGLLFLAAVIDVMYVDILALILIILVIAMAVLLMNVRKRNIAEREAKAAKRKLEENYIELEEAYKKAESAQIELARKYEELKQSEERNKKLAHIDYLTDLPNRISFSEKLEQIMAAIEKDGQIAIMYIDLDNFKNINDVLGHSYGDELLIDVTDRMKQVLDENDYFARFGGDEFIVLTKNIQCTDLYEEKIRKIQNLFTYPFVLSMREFFITISIGIAFAPKDGKTPQMLIKNVDAAMYSAKAMGKNTYCYYDETINSSLLSRIELQSELRNALQNDEFQVFYQAQVDLSYDRIVGFEALVRWAHPEKGIITPDGFVQIAEETGLIVPIGKWVLFEACRQLKRWDEEGFHDISIAVNLSARQFKDADIVEMVQEAIEETKIEPGRLDLEITESIAIENMDYTIQIIKQLKEVGVTFSLDDFGTGYSSVNYLKNLPVNHLKIDKSFLERVNENTSDQQIVSTIIRLAKTLDLAVIAEGVENSGQVAFLKSAHCNQAQGYLYSRPIPAQEAGTLLENFKNRTLKEKYL